MTRRSTSIAVAFAGAVWSGCAPRSPGLAPAPVAASREDSTKSDPWRVSAVSIVSAEDFKGIPARQVEEWLEGRVAGLWVIRRPGGFSLRIRGPSSLWGSNEPLYVLDGVPLVIEPARGLYWLSPGDIWTVEVLKDADATALYGVRGANGVILITTRR